MKRIHAIILGLLLLLPMAASAGSSEQGSSHQRMRISQLDRDIERARRTLKQKQMELALQKSRHALIESLDTEFPSLLDELMEELSQAVHSGLPFLHEERTQRLEALEALLADPAASPEDKLGRVLEALTIEARYGSDLHVRSGTIETDQNELRGSILRVGRLAAFFLTPDASRAYRLEMDGTWTLLPAAAPETLARGLKMRDRSEPFELLPLPVEVQQ
ncbi:DUF3450 family protein [Salidesulfovibrio brasiliensis]